MGLLHSRLFSFFLILNCLFTLLYLGTHLARKRFLGEMYKNNHLENTHCILLNLISATAELLSVFLDCGFCPLETCSRLQTVWSEEIIAAPTKLRWTYSNETPFKSDSFVGVAVEEGESSCQAVDVHAFLCPPFIKSCLPVRICHPPAAQNGSAWQQAVYVWTAHLASVSSWMFLATGQITSH